MLFNKSNNGGQELRALLGFIDADTNFSKWRTWVNLSVRQITALTGKEIYNKAVDYYKSDKFNSECKSDEDKLVVKFQLANALFAYVKMIPSLDAGHSNTGRKKNVGEQDKSLTSLEQYKDETNILNLAYEALEDLLNFLEETKLPEWLESPAKKAISGLLISSLSQFNQYFTLSSSRMFYTMLPMIKEIQDTRVIPVITDIRFHALIKAIEADTPSDDDKKTLLLLPYIQRPLVLASLALAIKRLPVEILPDGIVQTQIIGSIREKRIATDSAIRMMVDSLNDDANKAFTTLQEQITILDGADVQERYVTPPSQKEGIKGFLFN